MTVREHLQMLTKALNTYGWGVTIDWGVLQWCYNSARRDVALQLGVTAMQEYGAVRRLRKLETRADVIRETYEQRYGIPQDAVTVYEYPQDIIAPVDLWVWHAGQYRALPRVSLEEFQRYLKSAWSERQVWCDVLMSNVLDAHIVVIGTGDWRTADEDHDSLLWYVAVPHEVELGAWGGAGMRSGRDEEVGNPVLWYLIFALTLYRYAMVSGVIGARTEMLRYLTLELDTILRGLERNYKLRLDARRLMEMARKPSIVPEQKAQEL
jgi:hypothetical protein